MLLTRQLRLDYEKRFSAMKILPDRVDDTDWVVNRILKNQARYEAVSAKTKVPWYVIAIIHSLEGGGNFQAVLHNGERIVGTGQKTKLVPAGRGPFATWEDAAVDALNYDGLVKVTDWSLSSILFELECYNGLGYRNPKNVTKPPETSPYLWSFSNQYISGKFIADGVFSSSAVSEQVGACCILHRLMELGKITIIDFTLPDTTPAPAPAPAGTSMKLPDLPAGMILKEGDKGPYVAEAQAAFNAIGLQPPLVVDGEFDDLTEATTIAFQKKYKVQPTAKIGPTTWGRMQEVLGQNQTSPTVEAPAQEPSPAPTAPTAPPTITTEFKAHLGRLLSQLVVYRKVMLSPGDEGEGIRYLKIAMQDMGYTVKPDTVYDPLTRKVVVEFQKNNKLDPDGIVGPKTWGAIIDAIEKMSGLDIDDVKPPAQPTGSAINANLFAYYSQRANYNAVYDNVMGWYGTTSNACVAFMSTALRFVGVAVPKSNGLGGEPISLVTRPFSNFLEKDLGWKRVGLNDLMAGDVCFTTDAPGWKGWPWHTYMFAGWYNKSKHLGYVVDNQGFTHVRNLTSGEDPSFNFSPFAYALRAA